MSNSVKKISLASVTVLTALTLGSAFVSNVSANEVQVNVPTNKPGLTYTDKPKYAVTATYKIDSTKTNTSDRFGYKTIEEVGYEDSNTAPAGYVKDSAKKDFYENIDDYQASFAYKFFKPAEDVKPAQDAKLGDKVKTVADSKLGVNAKKSDDVKETKKVTEDKKELPATGSSNLISTILSALGVSLLGMLGIKLTRKN